MLERLCPRLIPRTTALEGRSTRGPLAVTSGSGALFSQGAEGKQEKQLWNLALETNYKRLLEVSLVETVGKQVL